MKGVSGKNYNAWKVIPQRWSGAGQQDYVDVLDYRTKLAGLISRVHAEYFADEPPPFSGMPSTIINQVQTQNQAQSITTIVEIQEKLISEIPKHKEGSKERTFLEKVKAALPNMKTTTDILSNILKIASEVGLNLSVLSKLLHL